MWNVDIPSSDELRTLAELRGPAVVSIYLPTTPVTADAQADRIVLKNLADQARTGLEEAGVASRAEVAEIDEELADLVVDDDFWEHQAQGLAVIVTADHVWTHRLPYTVTAQVHVSDRAHLKPLLSLTSFPMSCYVLALAEGEVRLVEVAADLAPVPVRVPDMPRSASDAASKASISGRSHSGRQVGSEGKRVHIRHYARRVDAALRPFLAGSTTPLVLAAVEPVRSIFRAVSSYPHLVDAVIETNPDRVTDQELAAAAREILLEQQAAELGSLAELFDTRSSQGRALTELTDCARAATAGAVDTLIVDRELFVEGTVDDDGTVHTPETAQGQVYGVVDEIARRVLLTGGTVLSVDAAGVPGGQGFAAILRYPW